LSSRFKILLQYIVILTATVALVWFSLRAIHVEEGQNKLDYILNTWNAANKGWLLLMGGIFMISNVIRAERWRMLLSSTGHPTTLYKSFLSVMIGYLVNLVIPRGGEVSRCFNLYKLDKIPVEVSFGTVIAERVVDLLSLVVVLILTFVIEYDKLISFLGTLPVQPGFSRGKLVPVIIVLLGLGVIAGAGYWFIRRNERIRDWLEKMWKGFRKGLTSVTQLNRKGLFILYSIGIWLLYFLMTYAVIMAFDETAGLGLGAVLSIFAIGTIAMAAPLPGGAGSYHVMIPAGLVFLYQLPQSSAVAFTFVFHGWQTLILIVVGMMALILSSVSMPRSTK
jgi:glycosyltransferase 2 family protein